MRGLFLVARVILLTSVDATRFSSSATFDCPLTESDITGFLGSSGLSGLLNGLTGGSSSSTSSSSRERRSLSLDPTPEERRAVHLATRHALAKLVERGNQAVPRAEKMFTADRWMRVGTVRRPELVHSSDE